MDELIHYLVTKIVADDQSVKIHRDETESEIIFNISVAPDDYGKLIGKSGKTINAIRHMAQLYTAKHADWPKKRVYIKLVETDP